MGHDLNRSLGCCYNRHSCTSCFIFKVRAVMGIDFKMIKIHEIVVDSGPICKKSSGKISWELHYFMQRPKSLARLLNLKQRHKVTQKWPIKKKRSSNKCVENVHQKNTVVITLHCKQRIEVPNPFVLRFIPQQQEHF